MITESENLEGRGRNVSLYQNLPAGTERGRSVQRMIRLRVKGRTSITPIRSVSCKRKYLARAMKPACLVADRHFRQHDMGGACSTCDGGTQRIQDISHPDGQYVGGAGRIRYSGSLPTNATTTCSYELSWFPSWLWR